MPQSDPARPRNRLLCALAADDLALLAPHLEPVGYELKQRLIAQDGVIEHVLFVERGIVSLIADTGSGRYEVGMAGPEGLVGVPVLLGVARSPYTATVQGTGGALRAPAAAVREAMDASPTLRGLLLRYVHAFLVQVAGTAHANAAHGVEARLARWLLMTHDRLGRDEMAVTHDLLAAMLGARRPGVTLAVQALEGAGLIRATRGLITVRDRAGLEALAADAYGRAEAEYDAVVLSPPDAAGPPER